MADMLKPPPLLERDPRFQALGTLASRISKLEREPLLVYLIDTVDPSALQHLAEQFSLLEDGWNLAESDDARRALIRGAIELHRHKGTPWAIREVIRRLGLGEVTLIERVSGQTRNGQINHDGLHIHGDPKAWTQYRVILNKPITNDQAAQVRTLLQAYAPARCQLASLEYQAVANRHNGAIHRNNQYNRGSAHG
ncbi:MAG: phage tail protein I [Azovibrio sp.]